MAGEDRFGTVVARGSTLEVNQALSIALPHPITAVKLVSELGSLLAGDSQGTIYAMHWPMARPPTAKQMLVQRVFAGAVAGLEVAVDFRSVVVSGHAGELALLRVGQVVDGAVKMPA